jgi:hypothetical protein
MRTIQRLTTLLLVALTVPAAGLRAQEPTTTAATSRKIITPFAVVSYPTCIIIDAEGIVRARKSGYSPSETQGWLDDEIEKSLKKRGPS